MCCRLNIVYVVCILAPIITRHGAFISPKVVYSGTNYNYNNNIVANNIVKPFCFCMWIQLDQETSIGYNL